MKRISHLVIMGVAASIALATIPLRSARAQVSGTSSTSSSSGDPVEAKPGDYNRLLRELREEREHMRAEERRHEEEEAAERKRIDALEKEVGAINSTNAQLQQNQAALQTTNAQTETQVSQIQKTVSSQLGPFGFGDRINSFLGQHTFTMVGDASVGYYYDHKGGLNDPVLEFEINPMIRLADWIQFYGAFGAVAGPGGISMLGPTLANMQVFPLGQEAPLELVAGLFDMPFGDFFENQGPPWVNPFVTAPLMYGAEAILPPAALGLQARGGIQWGGLGQDVDYTVWADSGPSFESSPGVNVIPAPVIGERLNPLTGTNIATNGKGFGARFRFFPIPISEDLGRLELMATTYNGKWLDSLWYNSWGVGYAYRLGPFRTRGEWAQTYRQMPSLTGAAAYPGCCGHENREGWYAMAGYFLYGIPHPYLGDWVEPRFDKLEFLVRYSGVNQRGILANDITNQPVQGFNGSPSVFSPHAREVALGLDYWFAPSIVWQSEVDFELPSRGGTLYNFAGASSVPTATGIGPTMNDVAAMTQLTVGF
ncbi:MAG: hypothetical protein WA993_02610 [Candidatus Binatus sp.]|jgi:hypothetical protein|uniref:hypothetical protein n=1 Tax=Candidatus Binatus sp. TaxID=2811406 RepID=UPI003CA77AA1